MLKNYLTIAIRNLVRRKTFSIINILCLSLGITFSLLIGSYVFREKSINADLRNATHQYMIKSQWKVENAGLDITTFAPLAKTLKEEYPSLVANYYRYNPVTNVVSAGDNHFKEDISIGDTTLVGMYGFKMLSGNKQQPFRDNNSAVITASMAIKLFGKTDAINERISVQGLNKDRQDYIVSAVIDDLPKNSVTNAVGDNYSVFVPTIGNHYYGPDDPAASWNNIFEVSFIELKQGVKAADLTEPLQKMIAKYAPENIKGNVQLELASVRDYYLKNNNGAAEKMILTLGLIGAFILLMAVINFVNISIGTSSYRLKEIGLRKVFGSEKRQLIFQFLCESLMLALFAGIISLFCFELLRPSFNQILNTSIPPVAKFDWREIAVFVAFIASVGIIAGLYPAFILSSSGIVFSVKGKMSSASSGALLRKTLLVIQFSLTIIVFIGALSVSRQVAYVFGKDIGYNKDQLMVITAFPKQWDSAGVSRIESIKRQLQQLAAVKNATVGFEIPERKPPGAISLLAADGRSTQPINVPQINVDEDYAATYQIKMASGNFFTHDQGRPIPGQVVFNEAAAKALGLDIASAPGKQIHFPAGLGNPLTVAGVVKNYNYSNIQEGIEPLAFIHVNDYQSYRYLTLRVAAGNMDETIASVKNKWKEASPGSPFEYFFMDEKFSSLYKSELQLKTASRLATVLNLLIVLMGVFGVVAFTLTRRTREIAIRKVLGSNAAGIMRLFLREYGITLLIANLIAWPIAYTVVGWWLENYNYRIQQNVTSYITVALAVIGLAFIMIIAQCFKVATANPVKSLRTE